jgi:hypothetical protein
LGFVETDQPKETTMTNLPTISLDDLAFVTGGDTTDVYAGPVRIKRETEPSSDPEAYLRCRKQSYDQSPLWDQFFRPNREDRFAERACSAYRPK